jgi:hypothetical protein
MLFLHLGSNSEEQQWANYRIAETPKRSDDVGKIITMNCRWVSFEYTGMTSSSRGFTANRLMGYAESHDED